MSISPACAACGRALASVDAICTCEETRSATAAAARAALQAREARGRFYICPSCGGLFSRADLLARLFDPLRRRFGLPWPRLSCPHCATQLRSRHATSPLFRVAVLVWLTGWPLCLFLRLEGLEKPVLLTSWLLLGAAAGLKEWRESRDPHTYVAIPLK